MTAPNPADVKDDGELDAEEAAALAAAAEDEAPSCRHRHHRRKHLLAAVAAAEHEHELKAVVLLHVEGEVGEAGLGEEGVLSLLLTALELTRRVPTRPHIIAVIAALSASLWIHLDSLL